MPNWYIGAKANATNLTIASAIERAQGFASFKCTKRFNAAGAWELVIADTVNAPSALASIFLRDSSGNLHNGIFFEVDNQDGNPLQYVFSGPQDDVKVSVDASGARTITALGKSEEYWLSKRRAFQVPHYPYGYLASAISAFFPAGFEPNWYSVSEFGSMVRLYTFGDTSGTSAVDSKSAANGTYTGGFTLNQAGLIDDPHASVLLNGTTGYVSIPTAGLPTGTNNFTWMVWLYLTAYPSADAYVISFGTNAAKQDIDLFISSAGIPKIGGNGLTTIVGATAIPLNEPVLLGVKWDGTTLTGLQYSSAQQGAFGSSTPGALSITYGAANFGAYHGGPVSNYLPGYLQWGKVYNTPVANASFANLYAVGLSRFTYLNYDSLNAQASHTIMYYVERNASATLVGGGFPDYGTASPQSSFSTQSLGSHSNRAVPTLTMAADPAAGSNVTGYARSDNLLNFIQALALQGGDIGFKLELSGSNIVFTVYSPSDKTSTAVFSLDRRNLLDGYSWEYSAALGNHIIAGGANTAGGSANLTDRLFAENEDSTSISQFGYLEDFLDARAAPDGPTLQQAITGQLASDKAQLNINATITSIAGTLYFKGPAGKGWDLGDKVRVLADGQTFDQVIREVEISLEKDKPAIVTAAIGTPLAAEIMQEYQVLNQRITDLKNGSETLKTNY